MIKIKLAILFIFLFIHANTTSRLSPQKMYKYLIGLIEKDDAERLSEFIKYPLKRPGALPDIHNSQEFIAYYPILFDSTFKSRLTYFADSVVLKRGSTYGLVGGSFSGDIWRKNGYIILINYVSKEESVVLGQLEMNQKIKLLSLLNLLKRSVFFC